MSHGPESHEHGHEKIIGPDEDGFKWPLVEKPYRVTDPRTRQTTHRYPDGHYYTIDNKPGDDIGSAGVRLDQESRVKDPIKYGLYRLDENGVPIRPNPSSDEFVHAVGEPNSESRRAEALGLGSFVVNSEGSISKGNNEKRDIDARATPIIASYEARDRALAEGKSMEEAQRIGAEVYETHFGMKGQPIFTDVRFDKELPPPPPTGEHFSFTSSSWQQKFGRAASDSAFRQAPEARTGSGADKYEEATEFIHDMLIDYPASVWLKEISAEDMQKIIDDVRATRAQMASNGVTDKSTQDARIYRKYRMSLETSDEHDEKIKQAHGILWDLMKENPKGTIPF